MRLIYFISIAFLTASCASFHSLPPEKSAEAKKYMLLADSYYQKTLAKYNEIDLLLKESLKDVQKANLFFHTFLTPKDATNMISIGIPLVIRGISLIKQSRKREKTIELKYSEADISYSKAKELHNELATKIAKVRYITFRDGSVFHNKDFNMAREQASKAMSEMNRIDKYVRLGRNYEKFFSTRANKGFSREFLINLAKWYSVETEIVQSYTKMIFHLKQEIKFLRQEFERVKRKL